MAKEYRPMPCTAEELALAKKRLEELKASTLDADEPIIVTQPSPE